MPAEYFLLTFTLPGELRVLAFAARKARLRRALFIAAWATVQAFCRSDRQLKGEAGAVAVLHTHSRRLDLHPHVCIWSCPVRVWMHDPGAGGSRPATSSATRHWPRCFVASCWLHSRKLAPSTRQLPGRWVVDCKSVGSGEKALLYLGRYLYRGVIREADILACDQDGNGQVSFRYRDSQSGKTKVRTLPGADFLRLILQHVPPKGFRRARNHGFLHPNRRADHAAAPRAQNRAAPVNAGETPAGVSMPLLW